eukprot:scaffold2525_cov94-Isochrysis_galbana.AAC.1
MPADPQTRAQHTRMVRAAGRPEVRGPVPAGGSGTSGARARRGRRDREKARGSSKARLNHGHGTCKRQAGWVEQAGGEHGRAGTERGKPCDRAGWPEDGAHMSGLHSGPSHAAWPAGPTTTPGAP